MEIFSGFPFFVSHSITVDSNSRSRGSGRLFLCNAFPFRKQKWQHAGCPFCMFLDLGNTLPYCPIRAAAGCVRDDSGGNPALVNNDKSKVIGMIREYPRTVKRFSYDLPLRRKQKRAVKPFPFFLVLYPNIVTIPCCVLIPDNLMFYSIFLQIIIDDALPCFHHFVILGYRPIAIVRFTFIVSKFR